MRTRISLPCLLAVALSLMGTARGANLDESSPAQGNAEAARLYERANDYVSSMKEGSYSYAYLQFYWKRAQSNIDRILRVYPDSPTAKALSRGELKLGPYPLGYFKERVLYNLEVKQLGAFEDVNCAIFLFSLDAKRSDPIREGAMASIVEVLARRQRWAEALRFPVSDARRFVLLSSIFRVAAFDDHPEIMKKLLADASASEIEAAGFYPLQAEALALRAAPRENLYAFVALHPEDAVRAAALKGVIEREILIARDVQLHVPFGDSIATAHFRVMNPSLRDNVRAVASRLYAGRESDAAPLLSVYDASLGKVPDRDAGADAHLSYQRFLANAGRFDAVASYASDSDLPSAVRDACQLNAIELLAEEGKTEASENLRRTFATRGKADADRAGLAQFRGRISSLDVPFVAHAGSFAELPIWDPCVMATAVMEWSLTPNRSQRGATPWDGVVLRYAGGFDNLPLPKSSTLIDAASTMKPY